MILFFARNSSKKYFFGILYSLPLAIRNEWSAQQIFLIRYFFLYFLQILATESTEATDFYSSLVTSRCKTGSNYLVSIARERS